MTSITTVEDALQAIKLVSLTRDFDGEGRRIISSLLLSLQEQMEGKKKTAPDFLDNDAKITTDSIKFARIFRDIHNTAIQDCLHILSTALSGKEGHLPEKKQGKRRGYCIHGNRLDFDCGGCRLDNSPDRKE